MELETEIIVFYVHNSFVLTNYLLDMAPVMSWVNSLAGGDSSLQTNYWAEIFILVCDC